MLLLARCVRVAECASIRLCRYPRLCWWWEEGGLVYSVFWGMFGVAYAEKSAAAVAEMAASAESLACHTAPLWPRNVPILDSD